MAEKKDKMSPVEKMGYKFDKRTILFKIGRINVVTQIDDIHAQGFNF